MSLGKKTVFSWLSLTSIIVTGATATALSQKKGRKYWINR